jgi:hypothetical protein
VLDEILITDGTSLDRLRQVWQTRTREAVRFVYGPDLARGPDGRWVVLEDNVGCVGGSADSYFVSERYRQATGLADCTACHGRPDLATAVQRWCDRLGRDAASDAVAVLGCESSAGDVWALQVREDTRRRLILDDLGIAVIDCGELDSRHGAGDGPTAVVNFNVEESWSGRFGATAVALLNAPGTGVLGNKALLPWADEVVRFYLNEDPILRTPHTRLIAGGALPRDRENWVLKAATGRQGTDVVVLRWQSEERLRLVADRVRGPWGGAAAVLQRYVEPSRLSPTGPCGWDGLRIEIRPVSYVLGWNDVHAAEQSLGKAVSDYDVRRLNNISQGACYLPVLREPCLACWPAAAT